MHKPPARNTSPNLSPRKASAPPKLGQHPEGQANDVKAMLQTCGAEMSPAAPGTSARLAEELGHRNVSFRWSLIAIAV